MLKVNKDGSVEIYQGDAFSLMCSIDFSIEDVTQLKMIVVDENNEKIVEKSAEKYDENLYFVWGSNDSNLSPNMYTFYIIWEIDEQNRTTMMQNILKVKRSV